MFYVGWDRECLGKELLTVRVFGSKYIVFDGGFEFIFFSSVRGDDVIRVGFFGYGVC